MIYKVQHINANLGVLYTWIIMHDEQESLTRKDDIFYMVKEVNYANGWDARYKIGDEITFDKATRHNKSPRYKFTKIPQSLHPEYYL